MAETYRPKGATAIVMDPKRGEILALANWPRINANEPSAAPGYAHQDRAVGFTYEPGSTFKAITVAGALQDGIVTPDTSFDLPPQIQVADRTIERPTTRGRATLTTAGILAQSSNVGAITIGQRLGGERFDHWVRPLRLRQADGRRPAGRGARAGAAARQVLGLDDGQPADRPGHRRDADADGPAYAAIANGGVLRTPHVVRRDRRQPARRPPAGASSRAAPPAQLRDDAQGRPRARRHRLRGPRSPATSSPARPARPTRSTRRPASTRSRTTWPRSWASRRPRTRSCWSR